MKAIISALMASVLFGCAPVEHKTKVEQLFNVEMTAGIGDTVYSSSTAKNLPNAFGRADVFGRTTPTASTAVVFEGFKDGLAYFQRRTLEIETGATTMNSTPFVVDNSSTTTHSGMVGGTVYSGTSHTTGPSTVVLPNSPNPTYMERSNATITVDTDTLPKSFVVEGITVEILGVSENSVRYVLTR